MKKAIRAKKVKVMCSVPGCVNRDTYNLSRTRFSGSVIICEDCLREALEVIEKHPPSDDGTLFKSKRVGEENTTEFKCPKCGKVYKTKSGLTNHVKSCKETQPPSTSLTPPSGKGADGESGVDDNGGEGEDKNT